RATCPDLPMPVTIKRPCAPEIKSTAAMKARPSPSWMAAASVVSPVASTSSVRTAEAIRSPLRALIRRSVLSALGIEIRQYAKAGYLAPAQILYPLCLGQPKHSQASYTNARWLTYLPSLPGLTRQSIALRKCFFSMDARVKPARDAAASITHRRGGA